MMTESIEAQLGAILDEYEKLTDDVVERSSRKTARDAVQDLKNTSPRQSGDYASGWATKKQGKGMVVYNRKAPGLTHLLENGHVIRNKYGVFGRAPAHKHIAPVADEASSEFEQNVRRELSK